MRGAFQVLTLSSFPAITIISLIIFILLSTENISGLTNLFLFNFSLLRFYFILVHLTICYKILYNCCNFPFYDINYLYMFNWFRFLVKRCPTKSNRYLKLAKAVTKMNRKKQIKLKISNTNFPKLCLKTLKLKLS